MDLGITENDIRSTIGPYVVQWFRPDDPEWRKLEQANKAAQRRRRLHRRFLGWLPDGRRTQFSIDFNYNLQWANQSFDAQLSSNGPTVACTWRGSGVDMRAIATKRVHLLYLIRLLARLKPRTVLEVGSGNGVNLFVLAGCFPDMRFTGVELTAGGLTATQKVNRSPELPAAIRLFSPEPVNDQRPFDRITLVRGDATRLPFASRSFDLVYTVLALEQMEEVRQSALTEIRRVVRDYTAMIEPFREWNEDGSRRDYIVGNDYFSGSVADLNSIGLVPILVTDDMPTKLAFGVGVVVCRVSN